MRWLLAALLIFAWLVYTQQCSADVTAVVGIGKGVLERGTFEKFVAVNASTSGALFLKAEVGGWLDYAPGRRHSLFGNVSVGLRARSQAGLYAETSFGPGLISAPDAMLGSHPQFFFSLGIGILDLSGVRIGGAYHHVSNASLWPGPNIGRDFGTLVIGYAF